MSKYWRIIEQTGGVLSVVELPADQIWNHTSAGKDNPQALDPESTTLFINPGVNVIDEVGAKVSLLYVDVVLRELLKDDMPKQVVMISYDSEEGNTQNIVDYNTDPNRFASPDAKRNVDALYLPLAMDTEGKPLPTEEVTARFKNLLSVGVSYGTVRMGEQANALVQGLQELGIDPAVISHSAEVRIGNVARTLGETSPRPSGIIIEGVNDEVAAMRLGDNREPIPKDHFGQSQVALEGNRRKIYVDNPDECSFRDKTVNDPKRHTIGVFIGTVELPLAGGVPTLVSDVLRNVVKHGSSLPVQWYVQSPADLSTMLASIKKFGNIVEDMSAEFGGMGSTPSGPIQNPAGEKNTTRPRIDRAKS